MITWWLGRGADPGVFRRNFVEPYRASDPPVELRVEYLVRARPTSRSRSSCISR
jgi:hypothetical protein